LENDLGVQLFVRTSRGTHATEMGRLLATRARNIFTSLEHLAQEIQDTQEGLIGHVNVGLLLAGGASLLPMALNLFSEVAPKVKVTLVEGTYEVLVPQLRSGALNLIVGRLPAYRYRNGLQVEPFYLENIVLVVRPGHPLLEVESCELEDLLAWPWIMPVQDTTIRQSIEVYFHDLGLPLPRYHVESISVVSNRRMIMCSDLVGAFPLGVIEPDIKAGLLAKVPVSRELPFGPVGITYLRDVNLSRPIEILIDCIRQAAKDL
jgi:DNA-binding transcriptional LysR family regulator